MLLAPSSGRILFLSNDDRVARPAIHLLASGGHVVDRVQTANEARGWLRQHRADLTIVDLGDPEGTSRNEFAAFSEALRTRTSRSSTKLLMLARTRDRQDIRPLFEERNLTNFLAVDPSGVVDPVELGVTVAKILSKDIFGIERYVASDAVFRAITVTCSDQKQKVIDAAEAFAVEARCGPRLANQIGIAIDEMVTNAVYNAPVDSEGKHRFSHLPRTSRVELGESEEVIVHLAADARRLCVSVRDPFGSLKPELVLAYMTKCFGGGDDQVDEKEGGAGLGLYYLLNLVQGFVLNIDPGQATEMIGLFSVSRTFRTHAQRGKSFNLFVAE